MKQTRGILIMKQALGILMIVAGVLFGVWAGLWWGFIGGIVQFIEGVKATPVEAMEVAFGIARVMFAGLIGGGCAMILVIPGSSLASK